MGTVKTDVDIAGIHCKNPVWVASGTFAYGEEMAQFIDLANLGAICTKAITPKPRSGNPTPRIYETPGGMLNAIGLANVGMEVFVNEKMPFLRQSGTKIVVNVAGKELSEYQAVVERLNDVEGVHGYELNISCPNVKEGGIAFGSDPRLVESVVRTVKDASSLPVIVKMSPNVSDIVATSKAAEAGGADGLSLINTLIGMAVDIHKQKPILSNVTGGLSGPAIKPVGLSMVYKVFKEVKLPLVGIGGIMNATDAIEYMLCGATAIQIGTASFVDPLCAEKVATGIVEYCEQHGVSDVNDIVGAAH